MTTLGRPVLAMGVDAFRDDWVSSPATSRLFDGTTALDVALDRAKGGALRISLGRSRADPLDHAPASCVVLGVKMSLPNHTRHRVLAAFVLGIGLAGFTWSAMAERGPDDRTLAQQVITQAAAGGSGRPAMSHALARTREALVRADQARNAGDARFAKRLEGLAREWAELARDIDRATNAEQRVDSAQRAAASATLDVRKTEALLETLAARRARAQGQLQQLHTASSAGIPSAALSAALLKPPSPLAPPAPKGSSR